MPKANMAEAGVVRGIDVLGAASLTAVVDFFGRGRSLLRANAGAVTGSGDHTTHQFDCADVRGEERALEVAAARAHHLLMVGPPGSGRPCWRAACPPFSHR